MALTRRRSRRHRVGALQLARPITSPIGAAVGNAALGEAKFVAGMTFIEATAERTVTVTENGVQMLRLAVKPPGPVTRYSADLWLYTARGDQLPSAAAPARGTGTPASDDEGPRSNSGITPPSPYCERWQWNGIRWCR